MEFIPFKQRFGIESDKPVEQDFPMNARFGFAYLLQDLNSKSYLCDRAEICFELSRMGRFGTPVDLDYAISIYDCVLEPIKSLAWYSVYDFCERVYERLLRPVVSSNENGPVKEISLADVRNYFSRELNLMLLEDSIAYQFVEGKFQRRGYAQTQKNIQRMGSILNIPGLGDVRQHYNKARQFFDQKPEPDSPNCIKEALCALEACLNHYYKEDFSGNFAVAIKKIQGNGPDKIPAPISESILKMYGYRGSGQGVAHAAPAGNRVTASEAELILNLVASFVTYIVDISLASEGEIPF
jgi:hypothetical protein